MLKPGLVKSIYPKILRKFFFLRKFLARGYHTKALLFGLGSWWANKPDYRQTVPRVGNQIISVTFQVLQLVGFLVINSLGTEPRESSSAVVVVVQVKQGVVPIYSPIFKYIYESFRAKRRVLGPKVKSPKRSEKNFQPQKKNNFFQSIIGNNSHVGLT